MNGLGEWRHWPALLASTLGITLAMMYVYSLGVMIAPLEAQFGWTRAQITSGPMVLAVLCLFLAPVMGLAIDRFGPRRVALAGIPLYCAAFAFLSAATANVVLWQLHWALVGLGYLFVAPMTWTAATSSLFNRHRGMALAVNLSGTGIAATFMPALTNWLLEAYGWRGAYVGLSIILGCFTLPFILFLFVSAKDHPYAGHPTGASEGDHDTALSEPRHTTVEVSARDGYRSPRFIMLAIAATIFVVAVTALNLNSVPILMSQGISPSRAADIAGVIGIGLIIGRLTGGFLIDRLPANRVASVIVLLPIITALLLRGFPGEPFAAGAALFVLGLSVGAEYDTCAFLVAHHFGTRSFGALFGAISGLLTFGASVAPMLSNYIYDVTKSYELAVQLYFPAGLIASVLFLLVGFRPRRLRVA